MFTVLTDHKNLEYIHQAQRLNPRQVHWALFFTRLHFKITYRLGSKNGKVEPLLQRFAAAEPVVDPEPILLPSLVVASKNLESEIVLWARHTCRLY